MSEVTPNTEPTQTDEEKQLLLLKARADLLGIAYHPKIGVDKLKEKIAAKMSPPEEKKPVGKEVKLPAEKENKVARENRLRKEAAKLIRIRVTCMNPNKRDWEGEIFTVSNSVVGTHKKYVPFNAEDGWHVPNIIYKALQERKCQVFKTVKAARGNKVRKPYLIKEFSIDVLDPLSPSELQELAQRQAMANGTSDL